MINRYPSATAPAFIGRQIVDLIGVESHTPRGNFIKLVFEGDIEAAIPCPLHTFEEMDALCDALLSAGSVASYQVGRRADRSAERQAQSIALAESHERTEFFKDWDCYENPMEELRPEYIERAISKGWLIAKEG